MDKAYLAIIREEAANLAFELDQAVADGAMTVQRAADYRERYQRIVRAIRAAEPPFDLQAELPAAPDELAAEHLPDYLSALAASLRAVVSRLDDSVPGLERTPTPRRKLTIDKKPSSAERRHAFRESTFWLRSGLGAAPALLVIVVILAMTFEPPPRWVLRRHISAEPAEADASIRAPGGFAEASVDPRAVSALISAIDLTKTADVVPPAAFDYVVILNVVPTRGPAFQLVFASDDPATGWVWNYKQRISGPVASGAAGRILDELGAKTERQR